MPIALGPMLRQLRRLTIPVAASAESDAVLLNRFVDRRDEDAFAALVARHGPMVLHLCRRVLGGDHAAEDAFQACFLVLARRARSIRDNTSLAAWLHTVALRLALRARATARRQPAGFSTEPADARPDPLAALTARELLIVLDEEIGRLPEMYRSPVLLCCVEGLSQEEAARQLGWTPGSVKGRLERGRKRLHAQLVRRGLTLSVALATAEVARGAGLPASLAASTVKAGLAFGSAQTAEVSVEAARLAGEVLAGAGTAKLKLIAAMLVVLGLAALGAGAFTQPPPNEQPAQAKAAGAPGPPKVEVKGHVDHEGLPLPAEAIARVGSGRLRISNHIRALRYSPDGTSIVAANFKDRVQFWNASTGMLRLDVAVKSWPVVSIGYRPDGKALNLFAEDGCWEIDTKNGAAVRRWARRGGVRISEARFSPDGATLALAPLSGTNVQLLDTATGAEKFHIKVKGPRAVAVAFARNGGRLAIASSNGEVVVVDAGTGKSLFELDTALDSVTAVDFSPDGKKLLCTSRGQTRLVLVMDLTTRKELFRLKEDPKKANERFYCSEFSPDNRWIAVGHLGGVAIYDAETGMPIRAIQIRRGGIWFAFSADGKTLLTGSLCGAISQWDMATGNRLAESADPSGELEVHRFIDGGKHLLTYTGHYAAFNWKTGQQVYRLAGESNLAGSVNMLSPDRRLIAAWDEKGLALLDAKTGKEVQRVAEGLKYPRPLGFTPDSLKLFFTSPGNAITIVDLATGKTLHELKGHEREAVQSVISPDGRWFVSMSWTALGQKDVILWETATGRLVRHLTQHHPLIESLMAFSPNGRDLAVAEHKFPPMHGNRGDVSVIDIQTGKVRKSFSTMQLMSLAYSPDGQTLAAGEMNGTLRLWEVATGQTRHPFVGHLNYIHSITYEGDGSVLAASSDDAPAFVWDVYGKYASRTSADEKQIAADIARAWGDLADKDATQAFQAIRGLVQHPRQAVAFLKARMAAAEAVEIKPLTKSLNDLNSDDFEARQKALAELEKLGDRVEAHLEKALERNPTLEARRRLEGLLAQMETQPGTLRHARAIEALEQIASPEAVQLLNTLAAGEPGAQLTRAAAVSLDRIRKR